MDKTHNLRCEHMTQSPGLGQNRCNVARPQQRRKVYTKFCSNALFSIGGDRVKTNRQTDERMVRRTVG